MKAIRNSSFTIHADTELKDSFSIANLDRQYFDAQQVHRIIYNRIFLIANGAGEIQIDDKIYPICGSELILIAKGQVYAMSQDSWITGVELCFGDCFWERTPASANNCKAVLFNNASANQHIPLQMSDQVELLSLFNILYQEFGKTTYINKPDVMAAYLKIIMIKIANLNAALTTGYDTHENQLYRQFLELVSRQYQTTHEVADYAQQLSISARKLTGLCNRCGGRGAKDIINGQLIAEAKRSLQFSSTPVKEIAYQLNFSTADHFSHFFKKNAQVSPFQYRTNFVQIGM